MECSLNNNEAILGNNFGYNDIFYIELALATATQLVTKKSIAYDNAYDNNQRLLYFSWYLQNMRKVCALKLLLDFCKSYKIVVVYLFVSIRGEDSRWQRAGMLIISFRVKSQESGIFQGVKFKFLHIIGKHQRFCTSQGLKFIQLHPLKISNEHPQPMIYESHPPGISQRDPKYVFENAQS